VANPKPNKDALGKGIRSLLQNIDTDLKTTTGNLKSSVVESATNFQMIPVADIQANPKQPRKDFDETALKELSESIKIHDLVQPITVTKLKNGKYQLISGERRFRASQMAGKTHIPAYIREANDRELLELALLENLQREDLNAMEIALSYQRMMEELGLTQEEVAERMGKERSTVANYVRLLKLPPDIQLAVRKNEISMGHARALINVDTVEKQLYIFNEIRSKGLSVRQTEELVRKLYKTGVKTTRPAEKTLPPAFKKIEDALASHFSTRVRLNHDKKGQGSITIEYFSIQDLNKILDQLGVSAG
jgi:ParB family chromosome partitioning protein